VKRDRDDVIASRQDSMVFWGLEGVLSPLHHSHHNSDALAGHSEAYKELIRFREGLQKKWKLEAMARRTFIDSDAK